MTIADLVKRMREYFTSALTEGFTAAEALDLAKAYQYNLMLNDMLERSQDNGDKPWERK